MHDLAWSRYRVLVTLDTLINDLGLLHDGSQARSKFELDGKLIKINHSVQINTQALEYYYRKRSMTWILLLEMLTEQVDSYEDFAERHHVSVATVRSAKHKIQDAFANQEIEVSKNNRIVGNELVVRTFFMQLIGYYHADLEVSIIQSTPQAELINQSMKEKISEIYGLSDNMAIQSGMNLRVLIWLIRVQNGHYLHQQDLPNILTPVEEWPDYYQRLAEELTEVMHEFADLPASAYRVEVASAVMIFFTTGLVTELPNNMFTKQTQKHLEKFRETVASEYQSFFQHPITQSRLDQIDRQALSPNLRVLYFMKDLVQNSLDLGVLEQNFPIHARFTERVMDQLAKVWHINDAEKFKRVQFEDYFNTFMLNIIPSEALPPVKVAIGFVNHPQMKDLVCMQLELNRTVNFEFVEIGEPADLYISDIVFDKEANIPGYTWNIYPDNYTLNHFMQDALQIELQRFDET
nr:helix-turn-helix domain-containing protein [Weissella uvarum]